MKNQNFVTTDTLFARISENLSKYSNNGMLDTGKFYQQVKLCTQRLGLDMYMEDEDILYLQDYKAEIPCNFYNLESAWLCSSSKKGETEVNNQQGITHVWYNYTDETVKQNQSCGTLSTCSEKVLNKITLKEYVTAPPPISINQVNFTRPLLLTINDSKTRNLCAKECKNYFPSSKNEIWIRNNWLHSELKDPVIYLRYYGYPIDEKTGLPLILDDEIIINAIEYHLLHYFFELLYLNYPEQDLIQRLQYLEQKKNTYFQEALSYIKLPSFNRMVEIINRDRHKWQVYNLNFYHY